MSFKNPLPVGIINDTQMALYELQKAPIEFALTGSRYFSSAVTNSTDYDFFTEFCDSAQRFLNGAGFNLINKKDIGYDVCEVIEVWKRGSVDVQLVKDMHKKHVVQGVIQASFGLHLNHLDKKMRQRIWQSVYKAMDEGAKTPLKNGLKELTPINISFPGYTPGF